MISKLTAILTLFNSIHIDLPLKTSPAPDHTVVWISDPAADAAQAQAQAAAPAPAAPAATNTMQVPPFDNTIISSYKKDS